MWQNFVVQFIQVLKCWWCDLSGTVVQKSWALSIDQCWLQVLQFLVHPINLLNILLKCNGFAWLQKVVVDQMGSRPPNSDYDLFFGAILALGSALELISSTTELVIASCCIKSTFCHTSQSNKEMVCFFCVCRIREDYTSKWHFFICG